MNPSKLSIILKDHANSKHGLSSSSGESNVKANHMFWFPTRESAIEFAEDPNLPVTHEGYATAKNNDKDLEEGKGFLLALHNCEFKKK